MPATIPAKTAGSLGEALTDTRTPVDNEMSAVHVERLKSLAIEIATEIGETGSPAEGSILERLAAMEASTDWDKVEGGITAVGGNVTIAADTGVLVVDTSATRALTLPNPATMTGRLPFLVIDGNNNATGKPISLVRFASEQIDGVAASKSLGKDGGRWWVWTNGTNWYTAECVPHTAATPAAEGLAPAGAPVTETGTTRTLSDADHGKTIRCTNAAGCAITVPDTVTPGLTVAVLQRGAAAVSVVGSGTMTIVPAATFDPETAEVGSMATIYVETSTVTNVIGDLAAA